MVLSIQSIKLAHFRNHDSFELVDVGDLTILVGPNAAGKTNVVEAIQLLTSQTSFRHPTVGELIGLGHSVASIGLTASGGGRLVDLGISLQEGKKSFFMNGKQKRSVDLKGVLPSVVFTPDDMGIAKGSMSRRRDALDALGCQLSRNHYLIKRDYEKVLQHKNKLLKEAAPGTLLDSINDLMVTCGSQLCAYRSALFRRLSAEMSSCYRKICHGSEQLVACYVPSWEKASPEAPQSFEFDKATAREKMLEALNRCVGDERERGRSLVGPHLDRVDFYLDGMEVASFASQGQQRSVVLSFKMAEARVIDDVLGQKPVLLLDDVMSELDATRRSALVDFLSCGEQAIVTTTNLGYFESDIIERAHVVRLAGKGV